MANAKTRILNARFSKSQEKALLELLLGTELGASLPTTDPEVPGRLWNNAGVVTVSTPV